MTSAAPSKPETIDLPDSDEVAEPQFPWVVIVWNDPINLMSYVTYVFQKLFGYSKEKATKLMLDVHHRGRAVVSSGPREKAEMDVYRLHAHGLWATMTKDA
ncbi:MAG: ATP-dependent Clp protease adapter ClpS [Actinobacteria bacterium]|nr:MAG: ATP-dependent Clp protease adapter ClpS [Actinomycetota bacterium]